MKPTKSPKNAQAKKNTMKPQTAKRIRERKTALHTAELSFWTLREAEIHNRFVDIVMVVLGLGLAALLLGMQLEKLLNVLMDIKFN